MIHPTGISLSRICISGCALLMFAGMVPASAQTRPRDINIGLQAAITSMDPHFHNLTPNNSMLLHLSEIFH